MVRVNNPGSENNLCRVAKPAKHLISLASGGELPEGGRGFDRDICLIKRQLDVYKLVFLKVLKKTICNYMVFKHIYEYPCQHISRSVAERRRLYGTGREVLAVIWRIPASPA